MIKYDQTISNHVFFSSGWRAIYCNLDPSLHVLEYCDGMCWVQAPIRWLNIDIIHWALPRDTNSDHNSYHKKNTKKQVVVPNMTFVSPY